MLAVVQAMIAMTKAKDIRSLRESLTHRLMSLAKTHTLLAQNHWTGSSVREVAESELRSYGTAVRLIGDDITLRCEAVQPLAMALHELITNAAKYGALSAERGIVAASWRVEGPNLRIEWKERGGPSVEAPTRSGFGIRMISRVLAQIGGHIEFSWTQAGLSAHIAIPIDRICDPRHAPATSRPIHASEPMIS
jgi:two-component sensor histidine kinase